MDVLHEFVTWVIGWAYTPYGPIALAVVAFAESSFFPVPPDSLMIPLALSNPARALFLALVATAASVTGGMLGYLIGLKGGRPLAKRLVSDEKLALVQHYYRRYDIWAVAIAGFSPIPYKVFSISAGIFVLDFKRFIVASILGRGGRFFLVGGLIYLLGPTIQAYLTRYLGLATVGFVALLIGGFYALRVLSARLPKPGLPIELGGPSTES